jgi:hypothetical protein
MIYTEFMHVKWYFDAGFFLVRSSTAERFKFVIIFSTKCCAKEITGIDTVCHSDDCIIMT